MWSPHGALAPLGAALALVASLASACSSEPAGRPHIVLILIDTLRRDHVGAYGYERDTTPTLDALADQGLLFERTIAQSSWTLPSVVSLFTSRYPSEFSADLHFDEAEGSLRPAPLPEEAVTLAEALSAAGYRTVSVVTNPALQAPTRLFQGFETHHAKAFGAADWVVDRAIEEIDAAPESPRPLFLYLHFMDVHQPYRPPRRYDTMFPTLDGAPHREDHRTILLGFSGERVAREGRPDHRRVHVRTSHLIALYDGCLRFVDDEIGRLLAHVERRGLREKTVLAVTSDHGEAFYDHIVSEHAFGLHIFWRKDRFGVGHGHSLFPVQIEVPLVLAGPGIPRARVPQQVRLLDVAPTLLALAGADRGRVPARGVDLVGRFRAGQLQDLEAFSETRTAAALQRSLMADGYHLMRLDEREILFSEDAARTDGAPAGGAPEVASRLVTRLDRLLAEAEPGHSEPLPLDDDLRDALEALGYTGERPVQAP